MRPNLQLFIFRSKEPSSGSNWNFRPADYLTALVEVRILEKSYEGQFGRRQIGLPAVMELMFGAVGYVLELIRLWQPAFCLCLVVG